MNNDFEIFMEKKDPLAFVYIIHCAKSRFYKIGKTEDLPTRLSILQGGCPFALKYVFWAEVNRPKWVESTLHKMVSANKHMREWYLLDREILSCIIDYLKKQSSNHAITYKDREGKYRLVKAKIA